MRWQELRGKRVGSRCALAAATGLPIAQQTRRARATEREEEAEGAPRRRRRGNGGPRASCYNARRPLFRTRDRASVFREIGDGGKAIRRDFRQGAQDGVLARVGDRVRDDRRW